MSQLEPDPYKVLGLPKEATLSEIRAAHRKRVLKCHPDKILDQALRDVAQQEFQEVQAAYELLSDPTRRLRYDQKIRLADLRREKRRTEEEEIAARGMAAAREMREGHIVEERVPFDTFFEEPRFSEEPRSYSRKTDEFGKRPKAKEERKKTKMPMSSERAAKESRDTTKASHSERQRRRDKERRGQQSDKYESFGPFVVSDASSSSESEAYEPKPSRRSRESRSRPTEASSRRRDQDDYDEDPYYTGKLSRAEEHIERAKYDASRRRMSPQRSRGYESAEPESAPRRSGRSSRPNPIRSSSRHNSSYEDLEPRYDSGKPPKIPTATTMPGPKTSLRPTFFGGVRSATASAYTRPKRDSSRSRTDDVLNKMVNEPIPQRSSKLRDKYDSGYSSPNTPELAPKGSPKVTARYKIEEPIIVEPSKSSRYRTLSPERERERAPRVAPPRRAQTFQSYSTDSSPRIEIRSVRPSRTHTVEYAPHIRSEDVKFTREIRPSDVNVSPGHGYYYTEHVRSRRPSAAV